APFLPELRRSLGEKRDALPGGLGAALRRAGKRIAYVGPGSDSGSLPGPGFLCAMDEGGGVPIALSPDRPEAPAWARAGVGALRRADLVVLDLPRGVGADG